MQYVIAIIFIPGCGHIPLAGCPTKRYLLLAQPMNEVLTRVSPSHPLSMGTFGTVHDCLAVTHHTVPLFKACRCSHAPINPTQ